MTKTLGIDIGTNSIGWALIDNDKPVEYGVRVFANERTAARQNRRTKQRLIQKALAFYRQRKVIKKNPIIIALLSCVFLTALLTTINLSNWQFWLNLSLTTLVATLTIVHQDRKANNK